METRFERFEPSKWRMVPAVADLWDEATTVGAAAVEVGEHRAGADEEHVVPLAERLVAERLREVALADARGAEDPDSLGAADPGARGELVNLLTVEFLRRPGEWCRRRKGRPRCERGSWGSGPC